MLHPREPLAREKKGGAVGKTKRGKGTKWLVVADGTCIPMGASLTLASRAEVTLVQQALETVSVRRRRGGAPRCKPKRLTADQSHAADWLRFVLWSRGI